MPVGFLLQDPGHGRLWLDTEGREGGTIFYRFVLPQSVLAAPSTAVVPVADLQRDGSLFPAGP